MFIRRKMSAKASYQELKQYPCFKELTKFIDVLILKQILPMVVVKISIDPLKECLNRNNIMYVLEEPHYAITSTNISDTITNFKSCVGFKSSKDICKIKYFTIERKIYNILKQVFHKKIDCLSHLKSFQKLNFLYRCGLDPIQFGGYVYRKQDQIFSIYYLVSGQIKICKPVDQKEYYICSLFEGSFFGLYELSLNKAKRTLNAQSVSNNTLVLSIGLDLLVQIFSKDQNQTLNKIISLPCQIQKIKATKAKKMILSQIMQKKGYFIKADEFRRRIIKFTDQRNLDRSEPVLYKYIEDKYLIYKIKDSKDNIFQSKQRAKKVSQSHQNRTITKSFNLSQHQMFNLRNHISNINKTQKENKIKNCESNAKFIQTNLSLGPTSQLSLSRRLINSKNSSKMTLKSFSSPRYQLNNFHHGFA